MNSGQVGIIGAGNIGRSIAVDCILHGMSVVLIDITNEILMTAKDEILSYVRFIPISQPEQFQRVALSLPKIEISIEMTALRSCTFVIENVPELWSVKKAVYGQIAEACKEAVCICANTSCTPIGRIASETNCKDRIIGLHFMNPSYLKKVVEVIPSEFTSEACLDGANCLLRHLNKKAVFVKDLPGFVSNRLSHLLMNEAALMVQEQNASPETIDSIFEDCFNHRMGPLKTADLIGLDTIMNSLDVLYECLRDEKYRCCELIRNKVSSGYLGKKSGYGFYQY